MRPAHDYMCRHGLAPCRCILLWIIWWTVEFYGEFFGDLAARGHALN